MKKELRVALYERISVKGENSGAFIQKQKDTLEEFCKAKGYEIVAHYTDEGASNSKPILERPALKQLLNDVQAGKIDIIIFTTIDRLTRNIDEYHKVQEILDSHNVAWQAVLEDYNTVTAEGRFKVSITFHR